MSSSFNSSSSLSFEFNKAISTMSPLSSYTGNRVFVLTIRISCCSRTCLLSFENLREYDVKVQFIALYFILKFICCINTSVSRDELRIRTLYWASSKFLRGLLFSHRSMQGVFLRDRLVTTWNILALNNLTLENSQSLSIKKQNKKFYIFKSRQTLIQNIKQDEVFWHWQ